MDMKKGGSLLTEVGKIVAPMVAKKLMDMGLAKAGMGTPIEDQQFSVSDVIRTGKRVFGGKKGMGTPIEDQQFSISDVIRTGKRMFGGKFTKKQLTQIILDKNKVIADLEQTAYGKGLFAGGGMETSFIQTGISYKDADVQGFSPYKEKSNPYT
jgi:hypothetical protein